MHHGDRQHPDRCRLVQQRVHPDLFVLMPEVLRQQHAWPLADDKPESEEGKRKPSKQIRIAEVRLASDWVTRTTARGRAKVVVLHPAEQLNLQAANALLKTLEEPPAGTRLLLTASDPLLLLPTVRSRCQRVPLGAPAADEALAWLAAAGVADADVLLAAASGRPLEAQGLDEAGVDSACWAALPRAVARGEGAVFGGWPLPRVIDALLKLCHDALALAAGGGARYFPVAAVPRAGDPKALADWSRELVRVARYDEHPWHEGLLLDALVSQGQRALTLRA